MKSLSEWVGRERREDGQCTLLHKLLHQVFNCHVLVQRISKGYFSVCLLISTSLEIVQESHDDIMRSDAN